MLRAELEDGSWPRLQMALIVAIAGLIGLLASFAMLQAGLQSMAVRYPLALVFAYTAFLLMLWIWLRASRSDHGPDLPDPGIDLPGGSGSGTRAFNSDAPPEWSSGGGGDFAGGGASESWNVGDVLPSEAPSGLNVVAEGLGAADEAAVPIALLAAAAALVVVLAFASMYVIWTAPVLFAELLFDGALSYALYKRIRKTERRHWFNTALRLTVVPFLLTAIFLGLLGWAMHAYAPNAASIGDVVKVIKARSH